ncbi:MAG: ParB/RepB/Spo0J family partition protein [Chloroflexota bacterium]|nr:ParB/RepB/Spo0J family partition protein [Chloroflexota bacterium]
MTEPHRRNGGLGRGLAALIPQRTDSGAPSEIPLARIRRNPYQPRQKLDRESLERLAGSIAQHGILQPVIVTETLDGYELVAGERRLRAAELAGLDRVPAVIRQAAGRERLELALIENIQRADLNAIEEANAYRQLMDEFGLGQEEIAARLGRSRSAIANTLRLLELSAAVRAAVSDGAISEGHARAIGGLERRDAQDELLAVVVSRGLSVRETEELARRLKDRDGQRPGRRAVRLADPDVERLEAELRTALGTKVSVSSSRRGGRIVIEYYDRDDLARLHGRLTGGAP